MSDQVMSLDTTMVPDLGADISVQGMTFEDGRFSGSGGGLSVTTEDADISVADCAFTKNQALDSPASQIYDGGGAGAFLFANGNGDVSVSGSAFIDNEAAGSGGAMFAVLVNGDVKIQNNVFHSNLSAGEVGGGPTAFALGGGIDFLNNIVRENIATGGLGVAGGAGFFSMGAVNVVHNTFFDNAASTAGGIALSASEVNVFNNLFAENTGGTSADVFVDDTSVTPVVHLFNNILSEFCLGSGSCDVGALGDNQGGNLIGVDPLLTDPAAGDFHLKAGSPAINAGSLEAPILLDTDFEGDARLQGSAPDIGADETDACGNGTVETGEECDDGNLADGDGCSAACETETPGTTTGGTGGSGDGETGGGCGLVL